MIAELLTLVLITGIVAVTMREPFAYVMTLALAVEAFLWACFIMVYGHIGTYEVNGR